jgi:hypothetical protein
MAIAKEETVVVEEQPKQVEIKIDEVENFAIIVNVQGWRMRVYYDVDFNYENLRQSQFITVSYLGDIEDPFSIQFEKLK